MFQSSILLNYNSSHLDGIDQEVGWIKFQFSIILNYNSLFLGGVDQVLFINDIKL